MEMRSKLRTIRTRTTWEISRTSSRITTSSAKTLATRVGGKCPKTEAIFLKAEAGEALTTVEITSRAAEVDVAPMTVEIVSRISGAAVLMVAETGETVVWVVDVAWVAGRTKETGVAITISSNRTTITVVNSR